MNLIPQIESQINSLLARGHYANADELMTKALKLLEYEEKLKSLRNAIKEGRASGPGEEWTMDEFLEEHHARKAESDAKENH